MADEGVHGMSGSRGRPTDSEMIILDAVKKRAPTTLGTNNVSQENGVMGGPRDRVEDMLASIVGLEHIKSQVSPVPCSGIDI